MGSDWKKGEKLRWTRCREQLSTMSYERTSFVLQNHSETTSVWGKPWVCAATSKPMLLTMATCGARRLKCLLQNLQTILHRIVAKNIKWYTAHWFLEKNRCRCTRKWRGLLCQKYKQARGGEKDTRLSLNIHLEYDIRKVQCFDRGISVQCKTGQGIEIAESLGLIKVPPKGDLYQ